MATKRKKTEQTTPEWSHQFDTESLGQDSREFSITASADERKDLAKRLRVESIERLEADIVVRREEGNLLIHVKGVLRADITTQCAVSLDLLPQSVEDTFEGWYADPDKAITLAKERKDRLSRKADVELPVLDEREEPEPVIDGKIDLGEMVSQYLSLTINPYPHKEGVAYEKSVDVPPPEKSSATRQNPFAALKGWKDKLDKGK